MKTTILLASFLAIAVGCTSIDKRVVFMPGSIINGVDSVSERQPDGTLAAKKETKAGPGSRDVTGPTGAATSEAAGSHNFIQVTVHVDDGVEGSQTDTQIPIDVSGIPKP